MRAYGKGNPVGTCQGGKHHRLDVYASNEEAITFYQSLYPETSSRKMRKLLE